jgi:hypothetical protein
MIRKGVIVTMKNFLFLSPHYPQRVYHFAPALARNDFRVFGLGDTAREQLNAPLKAALSEYHSLDLNCYAGKGIFDDGRYEAIYRTVAGLIARHGRLRHIESFNEFWLPLEARLREDFNVAGPRLAELQVLIRKSRMKEVFLAAGAAVARGEIMIDQAHLLRFRREEGAIIVKPDIGVGASDTHKISTDAEALAFYQARDPQTSYFMEHFIAGPDRELLSFDGLTDLDGNIVFATVHPVNDGILEIVQGKVLTYYNLRQSDISAELWEMGTRLLKGFGLAGRFFHIEFFRLGETYYGIEVNARPPGVLTVDMMNHALGLDIWQTYAEMLLGRRGKVIGSRDHISVYVGRVNRLNYRYSDAELRQRLGDQLVFSCPMDSSVMGDFAYLIRVPDHATRQRLVAEISARADQ